MAQARSRARERGDAARQALWPLGWAFIAIVVTASVQAHPAPGLQGAGLGVTLALAVYAAAVATAVTPGWARRGLAAQAAVIGLIGGAGVALAAWQPHGPVELAAPVESGSPRSGCRPLRPPPPPGRSRPRSPWPQA